MTYKVTALLPSSIAHRHAVRYCSITALIGTFIGRRRRRPCRRILNSRLTVSFVQDFGDCSLAV